VSAFCYLCDKEVYSDGTGDYAPEIDHIIPVSVASYLEDNPNNKRWVHAWCNRVKGDRSMSDARAMIALHRVLKTAPATLI